MDVWEAIEKRRTIRQFKGKVPDEMLRRLIRAGSRAPSASNSQPWEFIIINDDRVIIEIAEQKGILEGLRGGPRRVAIEKGLYRNSSIIAVCNKKGGYGSVGAWMAVQNIALAATAEGLGCVMSVFHGEPRAIVEKMLGIPETHELATILALGVPEGIPPKVGQDRPDLSWLHIDKFGNPA
jgi:5,6-dimethylbenzimidazole synthase